MKNTEKSAVLLLIAALLMAASALIFIFIMGFLYSLPLFAGAILFTLASLMFSKANKKDENNQNENKKDDQNDRKL